MQLSDARYVNDIGWYDVTVTLSGRDPFEYTVAPDDEAPLAQAIRALAQASNLQIVPFVPPTPEDIRAALPTLSPRQLRLALVRANIPLAQVRAALDAIPDPQEREEALIEWDYATEYRRTHPLITSMALAFGLNDEQLDLLWTAAASL